jgi:hypothetical protein
MMGDVASAAARDEYLRPDAPRRFEHDDARRAPVHGCAMKRFSREDGGRESRRPRAHDCNITSSFHVSRAGILEDAPTDRYGKGASFERIKIAHRADWRLGRENRCPFCEFADIMANREGL